MRLYIGIWVDLHPKGGKAGPGGIHPQIELVVALHQIDTLLRDDIRPGKHGELGVYITV